MTNTIQTLITIIILLHVQDLRETHLITIKRIFIRNPKFAR